MNLSCGCAVALLLSWATAADATTLYTWKDGHGVSHYAQSPPADQRYRVRRIDASARTLPEAADAPTPEPAQCSRARDNLRLLQGQQPVLHDSDGDGTADAPLDPNQRAAQQNLAEAALRAYCPTSPPAEAD